MDIDKTLRIYRAWLYCVEKCKLVYSEGQIKGFVALIFGLSVSELNDIILIEQSFLTRKS